ncbi:heat shock factor-binding protein 1-like protein 1 [Brienomyrus brachyistius]|uniref:heat shock factor-binding protein 1-like protein 1 n=1 Tax=Brienomyrus brachyistius TaxID=42636 RepID=UPI0020B2E41C|nr:heat shock factor-binding protein 1-like protein 1 [Brienomyrus brachyistius]
MAESNWNAAQDLTDFMETTMQKLQKRFQDMSDQLVSRMDEMGTRIDDLEKNVADLMKQAGMEEPQSSK